MTQQEKQQAIIKAVQDSLPELMELSFGCRVENRTDGEISQDFEDGIIVNILHSTSWATYHLDNGTILHEEDISNTGVNVLGHPITLHHVLQWNEDLMFRYGELCFEIDCCGFNGCGHPQEYRSAAWNFSKPNDLQEQLEASEELTELLYSLTHLIL